MRALAAVAVAAALAAAATAGSAQSSLRAQLAAADGDVRFHFPAREGVCGDADAIVRQRPGGRSIMMSGRWDGTRDTDDLASWCRPGPVEVRLRLSGGDVTDVRLGLGPDAFTDARDLGAVSATEAVEVLVNDVAPRVSRNTSGRALMAASMAAADSWPAMLALARNPNAPDHVRKQAKNHVAGEASDRLLAERPYLDDETEIRREAVFALSRRKDDQSRDALRRLARSEPDPAVRAAALFWLGNTDGEEALQLMEDVLRR